MYLTTTWDKLLNFRRIQTRNSRLSKNASWNWSSFLSSQQLWTGIQNSYFIPNTTVDDWGQRDTVARVSACISLLWAVMKMDFFSPEDMFFIKLYYPNHTIWKFHNVKSYRFLCTKQWNTLSVWYWVKLGGFPFLKYYFRIQRTREPTFLFFI